MSGENLNRMSIGGNKSPDEETPLSPMEANQLPMRVPEEGTNTLADIIDAEDQEQAENGRLNIIETLDHLEMAEQDQTSAFESFLQEAVSS